MKRFVLAMFLLSGVASAFAAGRTVTLVVDGMDCPACPITVRKSLERIDGVKVARVDLRTGTMELLVADGAVTDARLLQATADAGYPAEIRGIEALPALSADLKPLREAFNDAKGMHRILAVLSPTCGACRHGVAAIQASILSKDDRDLRVFLVWSPMLKRDNEQTAREAAATVKDPRVRQFLDLQRHAGAALRRELFPDARASILKALSPDHPLREYTEASAPDKPEWDIYLSYRGEALWRDRIPRPDRWIRQGALIPGEEGKMTSVLWLDTYASAPVEADLVGTIARLLP